MAGKNKVYLTGFMGSGKTTAGKEIAARLGWNFADLDKIIEEKHHRPVSEIFSEKGEDFFRQSETESLLKLEKLSHVVISTGGGAPCHSGNMDRMLSSGLVVYLKLTPEQLADRLKDCTEERPLIKGLENEKLLQYIKQKLALRECIYEKADLICDGFNPDFEMLLDEIKKIIS